MTRPDDRFGFQLTAVGEPLRRISLPAAPPGDNEVVIEVAGCGVCHTDVGFAVDGVPTRQPLPLILGHEISGRVIEAGEQAEEWIGASVIVPAVIPCGNCTACIARRPTICRRQFMPGNDGHGGFASHVLVPANGLCRVPETLPSELSLAILSVIADAVTTPLEAVRRADLTADDLAVFVGVGGVGSFGVQIAAAIGAEVVAIDIDPARLERVQQHGASVCINARQTDFAAIRQAVRERAKRLPGLGIKIFETSGTPQGQSTAFGLLDRGAHLAVVGYTPTKIELRLSNLMAFDAIARGNWGSAPERYPEALAMVLDGNVRLDPFVEIHPLEDAPRILEAVARHEFDRRPILVP